MKILLTAMSCTMLVLQTISLPLFAQEKHDRERPPFRGGERPRWIELARFNGSNLELVPLLFFEEVRKELELSDGDGAELSAFRESLDKQFAQIRAKHRDREAARSEELEAIKKADETALELLTKLLPKEKFVRLLGLFAQLHDTSSVRNQLIAKQIGIVDDAKLKKLRSDIEQKQHELMVESRAKFEEIFRSGADPAKFPKVFKEFKDSLDLAIKEMLTPEQMKALNDLKGADFAPFREGMFGRGFDRRGPPGPGGPFGPGGPPRRGGPPGNDRPPSPGGRTGFGAPSENGRELSKNEFIVKEKSK